MAGPTNREAPSSRISAGGGAITGLGIKGIKHWNDAKRYSQFPPGPFVNRRRAMDYAQGILG